MIIQLGETSDHTSTYEEFWSLSEDEWIQENLQHWKLIVLLVVSPCLIDMIFESYLGYVACKEVSHGPQQFVSQSSFLSVAVKFTIQQWVLMLESFIRGWANSLWKVHLKVYS
jgi:hypothetical protein